MNLDILCVTKLEPHAERFIRAMEDAALVIGAGMVLCVDVDLYLEMVPWAKQERVGPSDGTIEGVLDEALNHCTAPFVMRLDDDERMPPETIEWLRTEEWMREPVWAFPRLNLWGDEQHFIKAAPLWPDLQTRLTTREKAGGRQGVHDGSPFGTGRIADVAIEHHKFLVRDRAARQEIARRYESARPGAGFGPTYLPFGIPEDIPGLLDMAVTR